MSFIVMGMDYPTCCDECDEGLDCSGDYPVCRYTGEQRGYTFNTRARRMDKCPLRPLPEKHGRLIDANGLKETLDYYIRKAGWDEKTNQVLGWVKDEFIDSERTIVEAEGE